MIINLAGKVAIVTGAGQGIGEGIARAFARAGAKVVLATRSAPNGQAVADSIVRDGGVAWLAHIGGFAFGWIVLKGLVRLRGGPSQGQRIYRMQW